MEKQVFRFIQRDKNGCWKMKQLTILSGKGGTGKTSITASFAVLAKNSVVVDCDVDAPDLQMLLHPAVIETQDFFGLKVASIDELTCVKCSLCKEKCNFDAITADLTVDTIACEGCGVCAFLCPADAITMNERVSGKAFISKTKYGFMSHAMLNPGESNSGKLVSLTRQNAKMLIEKEKQNMIIIDGPPGIGCPVIASITGVDAAIVVTEPTMSGIHDLQRVLKLLDHFKILPLVCINMYDINDNNTNKILAFCNKKRIDVVGTVPFSPTVTQAMVNGKPIVEYSPKSIVAEEICSVWKKTVRLLGSSG